MEKLYSWGKWSRTEDSELAALGSLSLHLDDIEGFRQLS